MLGALQKMTCIIANLGIPKAIKVTAATFNGDKKWWSNIPCTTEGLTRPWNGNGAKRHLLLFFIEEKFSIIQDSMQINMNVGLDGYFTSIVDTSTKYAFRGANTMSNENLWTSSLSLQSSLVVSSNTEGVSPTKQTSYMHKIILQSKQATCIKPFLLIQANSKLIKFGMAELYTITLNLIFCITEWMSSFPEFASWYELFKRQLLRQSVNYSWT